MTEKLIKILKKSEATFPYQLLLNYKKLKIEEKELIVIIYILNNENIFNPKQISDDLNFDLKEVMILIDSLCEKGMISIKTIKNNGIREEIIDIEELYKKLAYEIVNEENVVENKNADIYTQFETEFGRSLSPIEYELISGWKDANMGEEVIIMALKEAVYNGVTNLRYIDKILHEWNRKNLTTKEAILKDKSKFDKRKIEKKELFDYDWLNEE